MELNADLLSQRHKGQRIEDEDRHEHQVLEHLLLRGRIVSQLAAAAGERDLRQAHQERDIDRQQRCEPTKQPPASRAEHRSYAQSQERADEHQVGVVGHQADLRRRPANDHQLQK